MWGVIFIATILLFFIVVYRLIEELGVTLFSRGHFTTEDVTKCSRIFSAIIGITFSIGMFAFFCLSKLLEGN